MAELSTEFDLHWKCDTGRVPVIPTGIKKDVCTILETTIKFLLDGSQVSEFVLRTDYKVFLEERLAPVVDASLTSTENTIKDLNSWANFINVFLSFSLFGGKESNTEIEREDDKIKYKFKLSPSILLLDATWNKSTDTVGFGSRVESILDWVDFFKYVRALNSFLFVEIPQAKGLI